MTNAVNVAQGGTNSVSWRNRIINGDMRIDQRNAGASIATTNTSTVQYILDRWAYRVLAASKFTIQQNAGAVTPPTGFTNYLGCTSTSAYSVTSSDVFNIWQPIEGLNISDFAWGTANAAPITLSFLVRSSLTGTFSGAFRNSAGNRSYVFTYTISSANTWEQKTVTIAGDTTGTWLTDNNVGLYAQFSLGVGSTFSTTAGSWQAGNYFGNSSAVNVVGTNGATFYITGVQLEAGSVASPFERRDYGRELMMCQRYAVTYNSDDSNFANRVALGISAGATRAYCMVKHPVSMRSKASVTVTGTTSLSDTITGTITTAVSVQTITSDINQTNFDITVASGLTAFRPYYFEFSGASGKLTLSAEF